MAFAQDVKVDFDKDANFAKYKSFTLKIGTSWNNEISEKRVSSEIKQTLVEKGWQIEDPAKADAIVVLHGATDKQKTLNTFYSGEGGYGGYGWRGVGVRRMGMGSSTNHRVGIPRRHPRGGHLRREDQGAPVPWDRLRRDLGQAGKERKEGREGGGEDVQELPARVGEEVAARAFLG